MKERITLCNPRVQQCPTLEIDLEAPIEKTFAIVDDDGTKVNLHPEHLRELISKGGELLKRFDEH